MDRKGFLKTLLGGAAVAVIAPAALAKTNNPPVTAAVDIKDIPGDMSVELFSKEWVMENAEDMSTCTEFFDDNQWWIGDIALCGGIKYQCTSVDYARGFAIFTPLENGDTIKVKNHRS